MSRPFIRFFGGFAVLFLLSLALAQAQAQTAAPAAPAASEPASICTDRPTKSNYACVVDPGHFQIESDLVNASRMKQGGTTTDVVFVTNPTFKYGLAKDIDIEAAFSPDEIVHVRSAAGNSTLHGIGDLFLRAKWNFFNSGDGAVSITALPYVKVPTARAGIGNRATEGGLLAPLNWKISDKLTLTTVPEFDALKNSVGSGRHASTSQLVNLGYSLPDNLTLYGELWGSWNFDPAGIVRQYSADTALAWGLSRTLQLDIGLNFGLNAATPRLQGYLGISQLF